MIGVFSPKIQSSKSKNLNNNALFLHHVQWNLTILPLILHYAIKALFKISVKITKSFVSQRILIKIKKKKKNTLIVYNFQNDMESYKGWNLFKNYLTHNPNKQKKNDFDP